MTGTKRDGEPRNDPEEPAKGPPDDGTDERRPADRVDDALSRLAEAVADDDPLPDDTLSTSGGLHLLARIAAAYRESGAEYEDTPAGAMAPPGDPDGTAPPVLFRWGPLEVLEKLGEGSYGEVYRARDTQLQRDVALKLRPAGSGTDEEEVRRFLEEARRLARVRHPNVLVVHGADRHDDRVGLWADLVEGETLEERLANDGPLGAAEAAVIGADLCGALAAIHAADLLHGDVKTSNVMRERGGAIVLLDFGSGRRIPQAGETPDREIPTGTPLMLAPEVLGGGLPDQRADVYALGVLLYRLVSGAYPVPAKSFGELVLRQQAGDVVPLRDARPDLPSDFVRVVERALSADPAKRFASAGEMERALGQALGRDSAPPTPMAPEASAAGDLGTRRPRPVRPLLLAAAVIAVLAFLLSRFGGAPSGALNVSATLYRSHSGSDVALSNGDAVALGDQLWLELETDEPLHVYVLNEDEAGALYVLFPVSGLEITNPIPPGLHRLPGHFGGVSQDWEITSAGGRETILVVTSRNALPPIEKELAALPSASPGPVLAYAALDPAALDDLRGMGGMTPSREREADARGSRLTELARGFREAGGNASDLWMLEIELTGR